MQEREKDRRDQAYWSSFELSAATGERITPAQLLGEDEAESKQARVEDAEQDLKKLMRKMKKAGLAKPQKGTS